MQPIRSAELVTRLGAVRARIADACQAAGRSPQEVTLIAVTKGFPASDLATLLDLGVRDIGESRDQEAREKLASLSGSSPEAEREIARPAVLPEVRWHMIGQLQTNKSRSVAGYASLVHTVDRPSLVEALGRAVDALGRSELDVLIQLSVDGDPSRGGVVRSQLPALADAVERTAGLRLRGVMAVAPLGAEPGPIFHDVAQIAAALRADHPQADLLSAGMSGDFEAAIGAGATHARVGTALLGDRGAVLG